MKKISILAGMVMAVAVAANAQGFEGMGWDNGQQQIVGRLGLGGFNHIEVGVGFRYDGSASSATDAAKDARSNMSASVRYLLALHQWDKFTGFLHIGGYFNEDNFRATGTPDLFMNSFAGAGSNAGSPAAAFSIVAGYQPELVLMQHLAVSTLFGLAIPVAPDFKIGLVGEGVSIVNGLNFRILF